MPRRAQTKPVCQTVVNLVQCNTSQEGAAAAAAVILCRTKQKGKKKKRKRKKKQQIKHLSPTSNPAVKP